MIYQITNKFMARPEVIQAEDRLNEVWLDCMEGKASFEDFKATLKEWEKVISKGGTNTNGFTQENHSNN